MRLGFKHTNHKVYRWMSRNMTASCSSYTLHEVTVEKNKRHKVICQSEYFCHSQGNTKAHTIPPLKRAPFWLPSTWGYFHLVVVSAIICPELSKISFLAHWTTIFEFVQQEKNCQTIKTPQRKSPLWVAWQPDMHRFWSQICDSMNSNGLLDLLLCNMVIFPASLSWEDKMKWCMWNVCP